MNPVVALDIETTGLDPQKDAIIEIGVVRFDGKRIEAEWSSLINPGRKIPPFITQLTGITDHMVLDAPSIQKILPELRGFVGDLPIIGHNVFFDLSFLRNFGLFRVNDVLDTYEVASVLLPSAGRYNLGALGQQLNILLPADHRALDDARVTLAVYRSLYEIGLELPIQLLAEIVRLGEGIDWLGYPAFFDMLRARSKETISSRQVKQGYSGPLFNLNLQEYQALVPNPQPAPLDPDEVASALEIGGIFSHHFPSYEYRPQQVEMLRSVTKALSQSQHLMVEAGTGTGKSMAYLLPAALWSLKNGHRVVISTNTINLQDQLIKKDIPDLCSAMGINLTASVMKGRSNYLCPRRLEIMRHRGPESADEIRVLGKVLVWLQSSNVGDRSEINLNGQSERDVWMRLCAEDEACTTENCIKRGGICPFYRARQAALAAHIVVVNHALLLADVATGNRVLPEYNYVIIDEAHHLEEATTSALSFRITQSIMDRIIRELGSPNSGALGKVANSLENNLQPSEYAIINQFLQQITNHAFQFQSTVQEFFRSIYQFLLEQREGGEIGLYPHQERILPATRTQPAWSEVEVSWEECDNSLTPIINTLIKLIQSLGEVKENLPEEDENDIISSLSNLYRRLYEMQSNLDGIVYNPRSDTIYWFEINPDGKQLSLNAAPLHIGPLMQKYLWNEKSSVVLTSATLTAAGQFKYLKGRLNAEEAYEVAVGSPFDYESSVLLYITNDIPEPSDRTGNQRAVEQGILKLCSTIGGKTLVLFTSYEQLKRTSRSISPFLSRNGIRVYEQGEGASASTLLENFRVDDHAVLFGTKAFWEGVDVPGEALSVLVIVKLPFDVPTDPIVAARSETFEDPFSEYSLPEAILRFRQGFGRLIRTQSDRGVVAIFDKRIMTKRYGRMFTDSLPVCTTRVGPALELPKLAAKWLDL